MTIRRRARNRFKSSRAAWTDIRKKTRATKRTHRITPAHTKTHFTWNVTRR